MRGNEKEKTIRNETEMKEAGSVREIGMMMMVVVVVCNNVELNQDGPPLVWCQEPGGAG